VQICPDRRGGRCWILVVQRIGGTVISRRTRIAHRYKRIDGIRENTVEELAHAQGVAFWIKETVRRHIASILVTNIWHRCAAVLHGVAQRMNPHYVFRCGALTETLASISIRSSGLFDFDAEIRKWQTESTLLDLSRKEQKVRDNSTWKPWANQF
jgi:hypothetical protein